MGSSRAKKREGMGRKSTARSKAKLNQWRGRANVIKDICREIGLVWGDLFDSIEVSVTKDTCKRYLKVQRPPGRPLPFVEACAEVFNRLRPIPDGSIGYTRAIMNSNDSWKAAVAATLVGAQLELRVDLIVDPNDDRLLDIWQLHRCLFPDDKVANSLQELRKWISELDENDELPWDHHLDEMLFGLSYAGEIVGYLFAQHYFRRRVLYISYLGIDGSLVARRNREGTRLLLTELLSRCARSDYPWDALITEVQAASPTSKHHGSDLFALFQMHASQLQKLLGESTGRFFTIQFEYEQPVLRVSDIGVRLSKKEREGLKQNLLLYCRDTSKLEHDKDGYLLPGKDAVSLFDTLLMCVYGDSYWQSKKYDRYLSGLMKKWTPVLEKGLRLREE